MQPQWLIFPVLMTDPHTGVALAILRKLRQKNVIVYEETVVVISTAHGLKFIDFKVNYHTNQLEGVNAEFSNQPIEIEADFDKIKKIVDTKVNENIKKS